MLLLRFFGNSANRPAGVGPRLALGLPPRSPGSVPAGSVREVDGPGPGVAAPSPGSFLLGDAPPLGHRGHFWWQVTGFVEGAPLRHSRERAVAKLAYHLAEPVRLGGAQCQLVLRLDEEQPGQFLAVLGESRPVRVDLGVQRGGPLGEQRDRLVRTEYREDRQRRLEPGVFPLRDTDQFAQPVGELGPAGVGDRVHRPLRAPALPFARRRLDEAVLLQILYNGVERAPLDLQILVLAPLAEQGGQLVGVARALGEGRQDDQRQQVTDLAPLGHRVTSFPYIRRRVYGRERSRARPQRTAPGDLARPLAWRARWPGAPAGLARPLAWRARWPGAPAGLARPQAKRRHRSVERPASAN